MQWSIVGRKIHSEILLGALEKCSWSYLRNITSKDILKSQNIRKIEGRQAVLQDTRKNTVWNFGEIPLTIFEKYWKQRNPKNVTEKC